MTIFIYAWDYKWHDNAKLDWHHVVQYSYWILIQSSRCTCDIGYWIQWYMQYATALKQMIFRFLKSDERIMLIAFRLGQIVHCTLHPTSYLMLFINSWSSKRGKYIKLLPYCVHTNAKWFDSFGNWISKMNMQHTKPTVHSPMHPVNSGWERETQN